MEKWFKNVSRRKFAQHYMKPIKGLERIENPFLRCIVRFLIMQCNSIDQSV